MRNEQEKNYAKWLRKAEEDEFAGDEILGGKRFPAPACFHFQQMAEKYLKALLVFYNYHFPKVHDLLELETLLLKYNPGAKKIHDDLELLNSYYVETRYPGDYPELTLKEGRQARESALRVKKFVLGVIENKDATP